MRVGLIAEGRSDLAVLRNIVSGWLAVDLDAVKFIVPEYDLDESDRHEMTDAQRSNWLRVRDECVESARVREFLELHADDAPIVLVQIDTAEASEKGYDVERPSADDVNFTETLRARTLERIKSWLPPDLHERVRYAITIEETDAWVLTLILREDTSRLPRPKERLKRELNRPGSVIERDRKRFFQFTAFKQADILTKDFRKRRILTDCATRNGSLHAFLEELGDQGAVV
jgi:hypothetical protein